MMSPADNKSFSIAGASEPAEPAEGWADDPCVQVTRLAASILDVPIALLSLPRADEYRFRVNIGFDGFESVPCRISFCAYTMLGTDVLVVPDARVDPRFRKNPLVVGVPDVVAYVGAPLISSRGVTLGTLCAIDHRPRQFTEAQLRQLRDAARIAAWLLEAEAEHRDEQFASGRQIRQLEEGREVERERLAVALHEGVAQDLFALRLQLQQLRTSDAWRPEADSVAAQACIAFSHALERSIGDVCEMANGLLPLGPAHLRIAEALREQAEEVARRTGLEVRVHESGEAAQIDAGSRLLLLRAAREALANTARHARACSVNLTLECNPQFLRLRVVDDGVGVDPEVLSHRGGPGLEAVRQRAQAVGGSLVVERNARGGTTLLLQLPRTVPLPA